MIYTTYLISNAGARIRTHLNTLGFESVINQGITSYESELERFESIRACDFILLSNMSTPDEVDTLSIVYAMLQHKPIVITEEIQAGSGSLQELIRSRLNKIYLCTLFILDNTDIKAFLDRISNEQINYRVTRYEEALVKAALRSHFRSLSAPEDAVDSL
jgi:hypothetical protein